jgi:hypothetical protein
MIARAAAAIDRDRLAAALEREVERFTDEHPRSLALYERSHSSLLFGVPMSWMARWAGGFPVFLSEANGARVVADIGQAAAHLHGMLEPSPSRTAARLRNQTARTARG